tara:strand:+ start:518 stop:1645 length:1128 start_codon:yes stop_codon:yes gene_type:complete
MEKKESKKSTFCAAAKKYPTKGKAFEAFNNDNNKNGIYIIEETVNGQIKQVCYGRCCNSVQDNELCHIHENQRKKDKSDFLYFEKDIKNKCDNVKIKKATLNMSYFKQMGDRGRNKANKSTAHDFKNEDDPILKVIQHDRNPKLLKALKLYAIQLLNEQNISVKPEKEEIKTETKTTSRNFELLETIQRLNIEHEKNKKKNEDIDDSNDNKIDAITNEINELKSDDESIKENEIESDLELEFENISIKSDNNEAESINNDSDDEYNVEIINCIKGDKTLYLEPKSMDVLEPEGDDGGVCIGTLNEIDKKYATIEKDFKYYTVLSQNKVIHSENGKNVEYYRDTLNDRIFQDINNNLIFKGRVSKNKNNEYKFFFD